MEESFQLVLSPGAGGPVDVSAASSTATIVIIESDGELLFEVCLIPTSVSSSIINELPFALYFYHKPFYSNSATNTHFNK